jgi:hypothetical protein
MSKGTIAPGQRLPKGAVWDKAGKLRSPKTQDEGHRPAGAGMRLIGIPVCLVRGHDWAEMIVDFAEHRRVICARCRRWRS